MTIPTVIDANCMKYFQDERMTGESGTFSMVLFLSEAKGAIAIDDEGHAMQEYNDCCKPSAVGLNLCDWIAGKILEKKIVAFKMDKTCNKDLQKMGLPHKDQKWIAIAKGSSSDFIVTEDIDLFDPKAKSRTSKTKEKIKLEGGPLSNFLSKKHGISVRTAEGFICELEHIKPKPIEK